MVVVNQAHTVGQCGYESDVARVMKPFLKVDQLLARLAHQIVWQQLVKVKLWIWHFWHFFFRVRVQIRYYNICLFIYLKNINSVRHLYLIMRARAYFNF